MSSRQAIPLLNVLARGPAAGSDLARALNIHQSTLSRTLQPLEQTGRVVRLLGRTQGARYGLSRNVGTDGASWPLYAVDSEGAPLELGTLYAIAPDHLAVRGGPPRIAGLTQGVPYFLLDARPAGFLGRTIPAAYPELNLPARVQDWTDDHALSYLTRRGSDNVGNLIIGTESLDRYLAGTQGPRVVSADDRAAEYPSLARAAMVGATPGSSAHGEHPKFSARLTHGALTIHVLVKFSPPRDTPLGVRWADLLIAEFVASQVLSENGISAARNEVFEFSGQVFLQSERFDRIGAEGRQGAVSLHSIDVARYGMLDRWSLSAQRLHAEHLLSARDLERITLVDAFGSLIANTDRHFGNITLFDRYEGLFELAPIYDMLPMLFAPQDGQLVERPFEPAGPAAATLSVWHRAREIAEIYWTRLCEESRLSEDFRHRCERCLDAVRQLPRRGTARAITA
ncbi:MAG TPA: type II toxin-antitoxin system HipA family toxin YjjJ [Steroidobacteraceae bacterium]|nr:type II toxin-antitoxin system HipA family toxin YjjJ [Steroidobacteraceae bacterium]